MTFSLFLNNSLEFFDSLLRVENSALFHREICSLGGNNKLKGFIQRFVTTERNTLITSFCKQQADAFFLAQWYRRHGEQIDKIHFNKKRVIQGNELE